jgi:hypothetical protein
MKIPCSTLLISCFLFTVQLAHAQTVKFADQTLNGGKIEWVAQDVDTGLIPFGVPATREYVVKNISGDELILREVRTTCHCTVGDWTREPIPPGGTGVVRLTYDALREGEFYKLVKVFTSFDREQSVALVLRGKVDKKKEDPLPAGN